MHKNRKKGTLGGREDTQGGVYMLTPKQERFCQNLEVKRMSQRDAYIDAYPSAEKWNDNAVDVEACKLANDTKILLRREEIRNEEAEKIAKEAKWTRDQARKELQWLMDKAKEEITIRQEMSGPNVSALINAVKELNNIYAVAEKTEGGGVLEDILHAVRGINND